MTVLTLTRHPRPLPNEAVFVSHNTAIKAIKGRMVGGYGVVFGSPLRRDRADEYFDERTDLWLDHYKNQPVFAEHTLDESGEPTEVPRKVKIGKVISTITDKIGVFFKVMLDDTPLANDILKRIKAGEMFWSSGAPGHLVRYEDDGRIDNWPLIELSATDDPAEPNGTDIHLIKKYLPDYDADKAQQEDVARHSRRFGNGSELPTNDTKSNRRRNMATFKPAFATFHQLVKQAVDVRMPAIKQAIKAMDNEDETAKMDGEDDENKRKSLKEMLEEGLQEAAETVAAMAGEDPVQTMGMMVGYVMDSISPAAQEEVADAVEEVVDDVEEEVLDEAPAPMMSAKKSRSFQIGGYMTPQAKGVNVNRNDPDKKPRTLARFIKAVKDKDRAYLNRQKAQTDATYKAMGINPDTAGGYLVPVEQAREIIELLRAESKLMPLIREVPMNSDTMDMPTQTDESTVYFVGENSSITDSEPTFGQKKLIAKKMACLIKIPNELLDDSDPDVDAFIREDITTVMANKVDETILRGAGTANVPRGILNIAEVTKTAISGSSNLYEEIVNMIGRLEAANVRENDSWRHVFHPNAKVAYRKMQDGASQYIWTGSDGLGRQAGGGDPDELVGYGWIQTTLAGLNSSNLPNHFFGNWKDVVVGLRKTIEIVASGEAGDSFQYDQTWIRAIMRWDMILRHNESIQVLTAVQ